MKFTATCQRCGVTFEFHSDGSMFTDRPVCLACLEILKDRTE